MKRSKERVWGVGRESIGGEGGEERRVLEGRGARI